MSDNEDEKPFFAERAKTGRAACKKCKEKCENGELRMAKLMPNPFGSGKLKHWYHVNCLFESFDKQRATTKRIESYDDIDGWSALSDLDRDVILEKIPIKIKAGATSTSKKINDDGDDEDDNNGDNDNSKSILADGSNKYYDRNSKDNLFREFRRICADITNESSYLGKTSILHKFLTKGSNEKRFEGNLQLWMKLLLPTAIKRIYNLQSKQLIKLFSRIFETDHQDMLEHLEQGDVSETIRFYFEESLSSNKKMQAVKKSLLKLDDVDKFLNKLSCLTKEDEQIKLFSQFCKLCTPNDLKMVIRLIKHDIKINAGPKHILEALHPDAHTTYQMTRDLEEVVRKYSDKIPSKLSSKAGHKKMGSGVQVMCPISPMLAEACKSVEKAFAKYPQGMYSEIKYDGERVQLHKKGNEFKFFSRNLKPVLEHKINRCKEFIPKAFPTANDLILDSEIIVVDTNTGDLLPFGTLGIHKKTQFDSSEVCLFIFDCICFNGEDLTKRPLKERRKILEANIRPIKNHVQLSEYKFITSTKELKKNIAQVLKKGLEGLVLKGINGHYEPGKRHWLKIKKDYLFDGKMADSADLVVLGGWFGTGKKGGMLSIFLMGCYDKNSKLWKTVTKVHSGLDDKTMDEIQKPLKELMKRSNPDNPPKWLSCKKSMIPDFITNDPRLMPVWEITGAEFSKAEIHTADGISIRFPRITKIRDDKSPDQATNLDELKILYHNSKESIDLKLLVGSSQEDELDDYGGGGDDDYHDDGYNKTKIKGNEDIKDDEQDNPNADDYNVGKRKKCDESNRNVGNKISKIEDDNIKMEVVEEDENDDDDIDDGDLSSNQMKKIHKKNVGNKIKHETNLDSDDNKTNIDDDGDSDDGRNKKLLLLCKNEKSVALGENSNDTKRNKNDLDKRHSSRDSVKREPKVDDATVNKKHYRRGRNDGGDTVHRLVNENKHDINLVRNEKKLSNKKLKYLFDTDDDEDDDVSNTSLPTKRSFSSSDTSNNSRSVVQDNIKKKVADNDEDSNTDEYDVDDKYVEHFNKSPKHKSDKLLINQDLLNKKHNVQQIDKFLSVSTTTSKQKRKQNRNAGDDDDDDDRGEPVSKTSERKEKILVKCSNNIFNGVLLYIPPTLLMLPSTKSMSGGRRDDNVQIVDGGEIVKEEELEKFLLWGGTQLNDTMKCTHALHKENFIAEDMLSLRSKYSPRCRHLTSNWLKDCISNEKIMDVSKYSVTLRSF